LAKIKTNIEWPVPGRVFCMMYVFGSNFNASNVLFISSNNESIHNQGQFKSYIALTHSGQSGQILIKKEILINFDKKSEF